MAGKAGKDMTPEERKEWGQKMKEARAKKKEDKPDTVSKQDFDKQQEQIAELTAKLQELSSATSHAPQAVEERAHAHLGTQGIQGVVVKYPTDKSFYPDPTDELYDLPELKKKAMRENFSLTFDVTEQVYENKGVTYSEPKFVLELWRFPNESEKAQIAKQMQKDGDGTKSLDLEEVKIHLGTCVVHEDKTTAISMAGKLGIDYGDERDLLNKIRVQRFKQWLITNPMLVGQLPATKAKTKKEMVIGNTVLQVEDSEEVTVN